jgi:uncharacterized protein
MKVIVTGGTGTIGHAVTAAFTQDGHEVWALSRAPGKTNVPAGVNVASWDAKTSQGWGTLLEGADALINLAGENIGALPWTNARKDRIRASRIEAGQAVVEAVQRCQRRPKVVLQVSGVGYYGVSQYRVFQENDPPGADFLASVAVDWEDATAPVESLGVRRLVTRLGVVLTLEDGVLQRFMYPWRMGLGGPLGSGDQWLTWVHMQDVVRAFRFLIEREDASGPFNVAAPDTVTNAEFGRLLSEIMDRPYWLPTPAFALKALLGEMSTMVLEGQRALPDRLQSLGFNFTFPKARSALEDLLQKTAQAV